MDALWVTPNRYLLQSSGAQDAGAIFEHATIDESVSDFVAGKVDDRLNTGLGRHAYAWFDPEDPRVPDFSPIPPTLLEQIENNLRTLTLPMNRRLAEDQITSILEGLSTRVQLLHGPPGTGKTTTTAMGTLARICARARSIGDIVLVAAHTHTALDNLLQRMDELLDPFSRHFGLRGLPLPQVRLTKVHSSPGEDQIGGRIQDFVSRPCAQQVAGWRRDSVLVIGGTTGALLKMARELSDRRPYSELPDRFQAPLLIVDEASMMVFPHFLALATLVQPSGEIMLSGDHRQLAPIVAHDWEREDRPPAVLYQPFASAFQAVQRIADNPTVHRQAVARSALSFTFRLPPLIRELLSRLYQLDDIELDGLPRGPATPPGGDNSWARAWDGATGLYLVMHSERRSRQSNPVEADIIEQLLDAAPRLDRESVAIVTPHRAQRSLLRMRLERYRDQVDLIDTVERMQGGERPIIIVSATASDPSAISESVEFILDLNRSNVAFSRARDRLIVVCSDTLLDHIPPEVEDYDSAMLWKSLRALCSCQVARLTIAGNTIRILTPPIPPGAETSPTAESQETQVRG
jgi:hypothetical protein